MTSPSYAINTYNTALANVPPSSVFTAGQYASEMTNNTAACALYNGVSGKVEVWIYTTGGSWTKELDLTIATTCSTTQCVWLCSDDENIIVFISIADAGTNKIRFYAIDHDKNVTLMGTINQDVSAILGYGYVDGVTTYVACTLNGSNNLRLLSVLGAAVDKTITMDAGNSFGGSVMIGSDQLAILYKNTTIKYAVYDYSADTITTTGDWSTATFGVTSLFVGGLHITNDRFYYIHWKASENGVYVISFTSAGVYLRKQVISTTTIARLSKILINTTATEDPIAGIVYQVTNGTRIYVLDLVKNTLYHGLSLYVTSNLLFSLRSFIYCSDYRYTKSVGTKMVIGNNTFANFIPDDVKFYSDQFKGHRMAFQIDSLAGFLWDNNEYAEIYDTTPTPDLRLIYGYPDIAKTTPTEGIYYIIDGSEKDFGKKITITSDLSKSHEKLQAIIDDECDFIDGTIADDAFADWTYGCKDSEIRKVIGDIMNHELHLFTLDTEDEADFIADPMSGAAVATLNNGNMDNVDPEYISYPIAKVKLTGAWVVATGDYLRSEWVTDDANIPSENILSDDFPLIADQDDLDDHAEQIGEMHKEQILKLSCEIVDQTALLLYGQLVEVCYPLLGIGTEDATYNPVTYENFMITRSAQNDNGMLYLEMISAFVFTRGMGSNPAVVANERIEGVGGALATYVDAKVSDTAFAGSWDGVTTIAPSKNAVYDALNVAPIVQMGAQQHSADGNSWTSGSGWLNYLYYIRLAGNYTLYMYFSWDGNEGSNGQANSYCGHYQANETLGYNIQSNQAIVLTAANANVLKVVAIFTHDLNAGDIINNYLERHADSRSTCQIRGFYWVKNS